MSSRQTDKDHRQQSNHQDEAESCFSNKAAGRRIGRLHLVLLPLQGIVEDDRQGLQNNAWFARWATIFKIMQSDSEIHKARFS